MALLQMLLEEDALVDTRSTLESISKWFCCKHCFKKMLYRVYTEKQTKKNTLLKIELFRAALGVSIGIQKIGSITGEVVVANTGCVA